jgi:fused signal recognition particle receptor
MFGFLKKKLKESIEDIKKVFKKKEEKVEKAPEAIPPAIEPISKEEAEVQTRVIEEVKEEIAEEVTETKKEIVEEKKEIEYEKAEIKKEEKELETVEELGRGVEKKAAEMPSDTVAKEVEEEVLKEVEDELKEEIKEDKKKLTEEMKVIKKAESQLKTEIKEIEHIKEAEKAAEQKKPGFLSRIFGKKPPKKPVEKPTEKPVPKVEKPEEKKGVFAGLFEKKLSEAEFENFFKNLEISFLEANIAFEVVQLLKERLKKILVESKVKRGKVEEAIMDTIAETFREILIEKNPSEILEKIKENKKAGMPTKFLFLGVNGVGKTTSLAKMVNWLQKNNHSCVISASDTFRAASIEQLEKHAEKLNVKVIKHKYGGDPAAVAFDAIEYAKAHNVDCVLIDSAGRQHTSQNLMDELHKLKRVAKPDFTIFTADALTGNDAVEQAREFGEQIGFDFSILAKADVDQKGGAILSVSYVSGKPIAFLGVGQSYEDLEPFNKEKTIEKIGI